MTEFGHIPLSKTADDIEVTVNQHPLEQGRYQAVVRDNVRQRAWSGEGNNVGEATTKAVRGFLGDRHAPEYIRKS